MQRLAEFNRRTLDVIAARLYFYYSLAYELTGELASIRRWGAGPCCSCCHAVPAACKWHELTIAAT